MLPSQTLLQIAHPEGEVSATLAPCQSDTFPINTAGGIFHVRFDPDARVSAQGGMVPFAQFLQASQLFARWVADAPLSYASNRAHDVIDVLGTILLSMLNGHYRFAHMMALRGDTVTPGLLGMKQVVSEDSVRRALKRLVETPAQCDLTMAWLRHHQRTTLEPLFRVPWVLDLDVTIKPVYGYQDGSVVGYNPMKPGRPCHALHSFVMARTRLVLDVVVHPGNEHTSKSTIPDFQSLLVDLPLTLWPKLVRGDCGFGTEDMMAWPEANNLDYLFKQRMTVKTKELVRQLDLSQGWEDAGQGWQGKSATLKLSTWSRERRVVVLRRPDRGSRYLRAKDLAKNKPPSQGVIETCLPYLVEDDFEYQVLVTSLTDDIATIAQCYRDRADTENVFDEIKNHWGWGGFTSHTFEVTKAAARMTALIYNWWSIFVRIADPDHHREAITSRPALLHSVVRLTTSGGQRLLTVTSTNGDKNAISAFFTRLGAWLADFVTNAEQWDMPRRWAALLMAIFPGPFAVILNSS
jgi:hypothetical protein